MQLSCTGLFCRDVPDLNIIRSGTIVEFLYILWFIKNRQENALDCKLLSALWEFVKKYNLYVRSDKWIAIYRDKIK